MADDRNDLPDSGYPSPPDDGSTPDARASDTDRLAAAKLRARVAELRHWCRGLLDDPATDGVLAADVVAELRSTPPAMSTDEAFEFQLAVAQGRPVPPGHPALQPVGAAEFAALTAERERLRRAYFTLLDRIDPFNITEEELLEMMATSTEVSLSELLAEAERELGGGG